MAFVPNTTRQLAYEQAIADLNRDVAKQRSALRPAPVRPAPAMEMA